MNDVNPEHEQTTIDSVKELVIYLKYPIWYL